jgi:VWFA-related protein
MRFAIISYMLFASGAASAQVHLDVVVRDAHSRIARNLEPADFGVQENGADGSIRAVTPADPKQKHLVSLLFDHLSGEPARLAREAALEMVSAGAKASACFGVFEAEPAMRARQSFTADAKAVRKAIELATASKPAQAPPAPSDAITQGVLRASASIAAESRGRPSVVALMALIRGAGPQPGRKTIVYFSQGLPVDPRQEGFRTIVSSANRASVAIYAVDAAALAISRDEEVRRAAALQSMTHFSGEERAGREGPGAGMPTTVYQQTAVTADRLDRRTNQPPSALSVLTRSTSGFLLENGGSFRAAMRRVAEELTGYYEITYLPAGREPDGSFRATRVAVKREKMAVQGRDGYFATPDLSGRPVLPYEIPLLAALERSASTPELSHRAAVLRFRGDAGSQSAVTVALEVPAKDLKFQQDDTAGVLRARVAALALVRAPDGTIVDRLGGDTPILCPPGMLGDMRRRFVTIRKQMDLPAGNYVLETAVHDRIGERFTTGKTEFAVSPPDSGLGLSSVTVVRTVTPSGGENRDAGFHLENQSVEPELDGVVEQGRTATVYFKIYPEPGAAEPVDLAMALWSGENRALHNARQVKTDGVKPIPEVLALDLSRLPAGPYELRVTVSQGARRAEERTALTIAGAPEKTNPTLPDDAELAVAAAEIPKAVPPTAEQQRLLETVRENALKYSERLPNFLCTQATRRMIDAAGNGAWRTIEESSELLSFYDGQEHYAPLTMRAKAKEGEWPASVSSAGEFGSMLKEIFVPSAAAKFAWLRREQVRGRALQVFSYAVDAAHSRYRITYRGSQQKPPVFAVFHGVVAVDPETGTVLRLTLNTEPLPPDIPVRQVALTLDYDEVGVADQIYLLPIAATIDVRLHKKTVARNEVSFRSYQRFSADSRITFQTR